MTPGPFDQPPQANPKHALGFSLVDVLIAFALIGLCAVALAAGSAWTRRAPTGAPSDVAAVQAPHASALRLRPPRGTRPPAEAQTSAQDAATSARAAEAALPGAEGRDRDGESAFPAGTGTPAPFEATGPVSRAPLRRYDGKTAVLWTDTRAEYATELMDRLDSFLAQAHAEMARILDVQATPKHVQIYVFESQERYQEYAR